MLLDLLRCTDN